MLVDVKRVHIVNMAYNDYVDFIFDLRRFVRDADDPLSVWHNMCNTSYTDKVVGIVPGVLVTYNKDTTQSYYDWYPFEVADKIFNLSDGEKHNG